MTSTLRGNGLHQGKELPDGRHNLELCLANGKVDEVPSVDLNWVSTCIPGKDGHRQEEVKPSPHQKPSFKEPELQQQSQCCSISELLCRSREREI